MTEEQFLAMMRFAFANYCNDHGADIRIGSRGKDMTLRELKIILLGQMMEMIEYYFRPTVAGDDNFCTAEEIEDVISHANRIMSTEYYIDLS